jgi:hypothetical protein
MCAVSVEGTRLGPGPLPLPDGPVLHHVALAPEIRERQPPWAPSHQVLGLRSRLFVRMANTPAHQRGLLLYLLKAPDGKPGVSMAYMGRRYFAANKGVRVLRQGSGSHPDEASIVGSLRRRCYFGASWNLFSR